MDLYVLAEFVIVLAASVVIIFLSHKLRLPSVVGFLLTGVLIGPGGLSLIKNTGTVDVMAEIGVVMLLFTIGLEFEPARLKRIQRDFWAGGGLQVSLTVSATVIVLLLLRLPLREAFFYGFLVSLSSTAVVLKILGDRGETDSPQGRISLGILIFQDVAIVPMIALVPVLADAGGVSVGAIALRFGLSAAAIAAAFVLARKLMPPILHLVVKTRIREVFLIATLFLCLGMALLTSSLGLSLALGAFLAGVLLAESEYSHQVVSDVLPFKDVFNSLFFISVGMLLDVGAVTAFLPAVLGLVAGIIVLKASIVVLTAGLLGYGSRIAVLTGLALAQVGEFSFVLAGVGRANGFLKGDIFQAFIASSILTILATPLLIHASPALAERGARKLRWKKRGGEAGAKSGRDLEGHVIIAGFGLNGRNLAHVLKESGIGYVILELNPVTVRAAAAEGEPIIFGDVSSPTILAEACVEKARGIVFAISDPAMTRRGVKAVKAINPAIFVIVRTRYAAETDDLLGLGADDVIPEEFETSIEIFTRVLERVPRAAQRRRRPGQGPARRMLRDAPGSLQRGPACGGEDRRPAGGRDGGDLFRRQGRLARRKDARRAGPPRPDRRDRHRRRPRRGVLHRPGSGFRDPGTGHAGPRRQSPGHRPGLPLPGDGRVGEGGDHRMRAERRASELWPSLLLLGPTGSGKTPLGEELERRGLGGRPCVHFDFGANLRRLVAGSDYSGLLEAVDLDRIRLSLATGALFEDRDMPMIVRILRSFVEARGLRPGTLLVLNGLPRHVARPEAWPGPSRSNGSSCSKRRLRSSWNASGSTREATGRVGPTIRSRRSGSVWRITGSEHVRFSIITERKASPC